MILAVGVDVVAVARIKQAMKNPRFVERILTARERETDLTVDRVAGRWAVKEALSKALPQLGNWHDVEVTNGHRGEPVVELSPSVHMEPGAKIHVSISHERGYAAAVAIVEVP